VFKARDLFNDGNIVAVKKVNMSVILQKSYNNILYDVCM